MQGGPIQWREEAREFIGHFGTARVSDGGTGGYDGGAAVTENAAAGQPRGQPLVGDCHAGLDPDYCRSTERLASTGGGT